MRHTSPCPSLWLLRRRVAMRVVPYVILLQHVIEIDSCLYKKGKVANSFLYANSTWIKGTEQSRTTVRIYVRNETDRTTGELGFYAMSFVLSLFASVAVQKNVRDTSSAQLAVTAGGAD